MYSYVVSKFASELPDLSALFYEHESTIPVRTDLLPMLIAFKDGDKFSGTVILFSLLNDLSDRGIDVKSHKKTLMALQNKMMDEMVQ